MGATTDFLLLAQRRRARLVETFVRGLDRVRTGRLPAIPEPQFLGAGGPRNPGKPGG